MGTEKARQIIYANAQIQCPRHYHCSCGMYLSGKLELFASLPHPPTCKGYRISCVQLLGRRIERPVRWTSSGMFLFWILISPL